MTRLSVNVNKLATLRNSRGKNAPDVTALSERILSFGAHGITVHPRPDGRHIRSHDVIDLRAMLRRWPNAEFNVEGFPSDDFLALLERTRPDQATLVPDPPEALTSNAGWDLKRNESQLAQVLTKLREMNIRASLFIDPYNFDRESLNRLKPDRVELYTEAYAEAFGGSRQAEVTDAYAAAGRFAHERGIGVNAGHDLNQRNLRFLCTKLPFIDEVSIGHALICEALEQGLETTIKAYLTQLQP